MNKGYESTYLWVDKKVRVYLVHPELQKFSISEEYQLKT